MEGEYYLHGVMETASGFKLNNDSTFEFFYSYGALDRFGTGIWKMDNKNTLVLTSKQRPPNDFALVTSKTIAGDFLSVHITDNNSAILRYVDCIITTDKGELRRTTNEQGTIQFPKTTVSSISLLFQLCPDRYSVFRVQDKQANYFEFRFEPWIAEVFLENFRLKVDENKLSGGHPLIKGNTFSYERSN